MNTRMLEPIGSSIWVARVSFKALGIELGNCMTVMQLSDKSLLLHSPNRFDERYCAELDAIGPVKHLVAPNLMHNLFFAQWQQRYPQATVYAPAGIKKVKFYVELQPNMIEKLELQWNADLALELVGGMPRVNEIVFYHKPSKTLIFTDLAFNIRDSKSLRTRLAFTLYGCYGKFGPTRLIGLLIKDRERYDASIQRILAMDAKTIVVSHGELIRDQANELLKNAFS